MDYYRQGKDLLDQEAFQEAETAFRAGEAQGDVRCRYGLLAAAAMQGRDSTGEIQGLKQVWPRLEAMDQDPEGCFILGRCYETGSAVVQDISLAMKFYTRAAGKGHLDAMFNLGCIYMQMGPGSKKLAQDYFRQAAEQGHCFAMRAWKASQQTE